MNLVENDQYESNAEQQLIRFTIGKSFQEIANKLDPTLDLRQSLTFVLYNTKNEKQWEEKIQFDKDTLSFPIRVPQYIQSQSQTWNYNYKISEQIEYGKRKFRQNKDFENFIDEWNQQTLVIILQAFEIPDQLICFGNFCPVFRFQKFGQEYIFQWKIPLTTNNITLTFKNRYNFKSSQSFEFDSNNIIIRQNQLVCLFEQKVISGIINDLSPFIEEIKNLLTFQSVYEIDYLYQKQIQKKIIQPLAENDKLKIKIFDGGDVFQIGDKLISLIQTDLKNTQILQIKFNFDHPRGDYTLFLSESDFQKREFLAELNQDGSKLYYQGFNWLQLETEKIILELKHTCAENFRSETAIFKIDINNIRRQGNQLLLEIDDKISILNDLFFSQDPLNFAEKNQATYNEIFPHLIFQKVIIEQQYLEMEDKSMKLPPIKHYKGSFMISFDDQLTKSLCQLVEKNVEHQTFLYQELQYLNQKQISILKDQDLKLIKFQDIYEMINVEQKTDKLNSLLTEIHSLTKQFQNEIDMTMLTYDTKIRKQKKTIQDYEETQKCQEGKIKQLKQLNIQLYEEIQQLKNLNEKNQEELQKLYQILIVNEQNLLELNEKVKTFQQEIKNLQFEQADLRENIKDIELERQVSARNISVLTQSNEDLKHIIKNLIQRLDETSCQIKISLSLDSQRIKSNQPENQDSLNQSLQQEENYLRLPAINGKDKNKDDVSIQQLKKQSNLLQTIEEMNEIFQNIILEQRRKLKENQKMAVKLQNEIENLKSKWQLQETFTKFFKDNVNGILVNINKYQKSQLKQELQTQIQQIEQLEQDRKQQKQNLQELIMFLPRQIYKDSNLNYNTKEMANEFKSLLRQHRIQQQEISDQLVGIIQKNEDVKLKALEFLNVQDIRKKTMRQDSDKSLNQDNSIFQSEQNMVHQFSSQSNLYTHSQRSFRKTTKTQQFQ